MDRYEALADILKDPETARGVIADSVEETFKNLAIRGIDFSVDELREISTIVHAHETSNDRELDVSKLDNVFGGAARIKYILPVIKPGIKSKLPKW